MNRSIQKEADLISEGFITEPFTLSLEENRKSTAELFSDDFDLMIRDFTAASVRLCTFALDGLCDELRITEALMKPLTALRAPLSGTELIRRIVAGVYKGTDVGEAFSPEEAAGAILDGNLVLMAEGCRKALVFSVQGYAKRSVSEPKNEQDELGTQEGFTDNFKDNAALLRRRLRTSDLKIELITAGRESRTPVLICYMRGRADGEILKDVKQRILSAGIDSVFGSGQLRAFLDTDQPTPFSAAGTTERPDTLAQMLTEGRIGIICDGTPFAMIVPYMIGDVFHAADDYMHGPVYAVFIRILRMIGFFTAAALPGLFVAVCLFHPEVIPSDILYEIAAAENKTPFTLTEEALIIHFIYEIVREAGLRMPVAVGHAVSIVGALVIGDAAVTAGLIAAPMLIVVALTAVSSSVIPKLHSSVSLMRFAFILAGGTTGLYGVILLGGVFLLSSCAAAPYGVPLTAPFSPFSSKAQQDAVLRRSWKKSRGKPARIGGMKY